MISGYQSLISTALGWHTAARTKNCNKKRYKRLDKAWSSLCGPRPLYGPSLLVLDCLLAGRPRRLARVYIVLEVAAKHPVIKLSVTKKTRQHRSGCVKVRPYYLGSWSGSVNVDGIMNSKLSSAIHWNHGLEWFATMSVELPVHTG
jgi:hypothetical protein